MCLGRGIFRAFIEIMAISDSCKARITSGVHFLEYYSAAQHWAHAGFEVVFGLAGMCAASRCGVSALALSFSVRH